MVVHSVRAAIIVPERPALRNRKAGAAEGTATGVRADGATIDAAMLLGKASHPCSFSNELNRIPNRARSEFANLAP